MTAAIDYQAFITDKAHIGTFDGFDAGSLPTFLFGFQAHLTDWALRKGRAAILADCGLGKAPMGLVWADRVVQRTNKPVLILTPIAVGQQLVREGEKFGIEVVRCTDGKASGARVVTTNYERLHYFDPADFAGVACDESSILKSFDGVRRQAITSFMRKLRFRLLLTATAAPNDYIELGTSSEALGELGYMDMLTRFFKSETGSIATRHFARGEVGESAGEKWRFKGHAETPFWRWVASWARALRKPSDLGFADDGFILPPLEEVEHVVAARTPPRGMLFNMPVVGLKEQREEQRRTVEERCEKAAELVTHGRPAIAWCHLNAEGDLLERLIPDAVQVSGADSDEAKEEKLLAFADGKVRVLITKPKIGAWGLNLQHCAHLTYFPTHSFEQYYQSVRRCWRFGQTQPVRVDSISSDGQAHVGANRQRKALKADRMFNALVAHMNEAVAHDRARTFTTDEVSPPWL
jgi:hypothetical protein